MTLTFIIASSYSVLVAEDFMHAVKINAYNDSFLHYTKLSLKYAIQEYFGWQGTYSAMFIQAILSPLNTFGLPMLRFDMVLNSVLLFISLLSLVYAAMRKTGSGYLYLRLIVMMLICFMVTGYQSYTEIFFWFSGAASFSFPLSFLLFGMVFYLMMEDDGGKSRLFGILSMICAFIAMGGTLMVAGMGCFAILLVYIYRRMTKGKGQGKWDTIVFVSWILFAFVNGISPGNYKRQSIYTDGGYKLTDSIGDTFRIVFDRWKMFFTQTNLILILCLILICGLAAGACIKSGEKGEYKWKLILGIFGLVTPFATAFPVAVGYAGLDITNRCEFMVDLAIILSSSYLIFTAGSALRVYAGEKWKLILVPAVLAALLCFIFDGYSLRDLRFMRMSSQLKNGEYQEYYSGFCRLMDKLGTYEKGTDVIVDHREFPESIDNHFAFYIADDPEYWINPYIAEYFGYNSIAVDEE